MQGSGKETLCALCECFAVVINQGRLKFEVQLQIQSEKLCYFSH
jgi:hypothetical protein